MGGFLQTPFLPDKKISHVLVDTRTPIEIIHAFKKQNIVPILAPMSKKLYAAVAGHPDMLMHPLADDVIVVAPDVYQAYSSSLEALNIKLLRGKSEIKSNYPESIAYNVARIDKIAFHHTQYTDKVIREYFEQKQIKLIHVNQGYAKCAVCIVNQKAIITADKSIAKVCDCYNIDVLLIRPGFIVLPGLDYGFIGGATGKISANTLVVAGNIKYHPDYTKIVAFCKKHNVYVKSMMDKPMIDIGSIIPLRYMYK